jgi:sugar/nucleoside kinase (ribokinase family)
LLSRLALGFVRREGLDESLLILHDRPLRRISAAASFPDERGFMTYYDPDPMPPAALQAILTASARALYVPALYHGPDYEAFLPFVQAKGMKIIMDGNSGSESSLGYPAVRRAIESTAVFLPNAREARQITGEEDLKRAVEVLAQVGPVVAVKAGAQGAYGWEAGQVIHEPAIPVTPVDTTGAGDVFSASFAKAWLDGRPLRECLRWGNIVGGLSTLKHGGTGQRVTCADVEEWLNRIA